MNQPDNSQAQDLDALFDGQPGTRPLLDPQDADLAGQLMRLAGSGMPVDPKFYHQLEQRLLDAAARRARPPRIWPRVLASLLGAAALLALVIFSAPLIQHILGQPAPVQTPGAISGPSVQKITDTPAVVPTPTMAVTPTTVAGWTLAADLPDSPHASPLYLQVAAGDPLNPESALAKARQLGIDGALYQGQGEGGNTTFTVSDSASTMLFFGFTTAEFSYFSNYAAAAGASPLPFDEQARIAEEWLKRRGLLDFPYRIEPCLTDPGRVAVVYQLENGSQYDKNPYDPRINVSINALGQITQVIYRPLRLEQAGELALRPAAEAWTDLLAKKNGSPAYFTTLDFSSQRSLQTWEHPYQGGETVDVYGYASVYQPFQPGGPPLVEFAGLTLRNNAVLISQIPMRKFLHVWGIYQVDGEGHDWLEPQGWEFSPAEEVHLNGQLVSEGGAVFFETDQDERFSLSDLPAGLPEGARLSVSGARVAEGEIWWLFIQTDIQIDQNLTFGSLPLVDEPQTPDPAILPPGPSFQPGDKIEALNGTFTSVLYQELDGTKTLERRLQASPDDGSYWTARLEGEQLEALDPYQNMPVKVWGTFELEGDLPVVVVDRFEPIWPGVHIEPWFGTISERVLEGVNVLILTDETGKEWVLSSSTSGYQNLAANGWDPGVGFVVEGYPSPEGHTFGGLPVLADRAGGLLGFKDQTRESYQSFLNRPQEMVRQEEPASPLSNEGGGGTVEKVGLVYYAEEFQGPMPSDEAPRRLQPLWRFSGHMADGRAFEFLLPAEKGQ